jgi:hypothetical protein
MARAEKANKNIKRSQSRKKGKREGKRDGRMVVEKNKEEEKK